MGAPAGGMLGRGRCSHPPPPPLPPYLFSVLCGESQMKYTGAHANYCPPPPRLGMLSSPPGGGLRSPPGEGFVDMRGPPGGIIMGAPPGDCP
jgi:hypothetical protein